QVVTRDGDQLQHIKFNAGFLGMRMGSITSLAWHPHSATLATGTLQDIVSVFDVDQP
ncbi:unnamed protein product, partial [Sphacelaria rigidula]